MRTQHERGGNWEGGDGVDAVRATRAAAKVGGVGGGTYMVEM
jgi:hypothetical protein